MDGEFELVLANAAHVRNVPGRKTDVNDATWLADLMAHSLVRGSFVPDEQTQEMRDFLRTRKQFVRERSSHIQRIHKTLEDANIKLDSVMTDIIGLSGRRMIEAIIAGERDPNVLAALAHGGIKATPSELEAALRGRVTVHHRFLLRLHLDHMTALDEAIARIDKEFDANVEPFRTAIQILSTVPGISQLSAEGIVAKIGTDMGRFPSQGHFDLLGRPVPKKRRERWQAPLHAHAQRGTWLKTTLIQCARAAARTKGSYLQAQFHRLRSRRGAKKALDAVAASILTAAYHMLKNGILYQDLGADYFDGWAKTKHVLRLVGRLQNLGFAVHITPTETAA